MTQVGMTQLADTLDGHASPAPGLVCHLADAGRLNCSDCFDTMIEQIC